MSRARLAQALACAAILLVIPGAAGDDRHRLDGRRRLAARLGFALAGVASAAGRRGRDARARQPVGWLVLAIGLGVGVLLAGGVYGEGGVRTAWARSRPTSMAWLGDWPGIAVYFGLTGSWCCCSRPGGC